MKDNRNEFLRLPSLDNRAGRMNATGPASQGYAVVHFIACNSNGAVRDIANVDDVLACPARRLYPMDDSRAGFPSTCDLVTIGTIENLLTFSSDERRTR